MDSFRNQVVDANKAKDILTNTRKRIKLVNRKTDEEFVKILIDEVNKYFSQMTGTCVDANDLARDTKGPSSTSHNNLISCFTQDINNIKIGNQNSENVLNKAVNFMAVEREGVLRQASELHSKIISHKITSSKVDGDTIKFTDFFNDTGLMNIIESRGVIISTSRSALTLSHVSENADNSNLIDPTSIVIEVDVDQPNDPTIRDNLDSYSQMYPLSLLRGIAPIPVPHLGYGKTLGIRRISPDANVVNAAAGFSFDDDEKTRKIQIQSLTEGDIDELGEITSSEYELIWTEMSNNIKNKLVASEHIKSAISRSSSRDAGDIGVVSVDSAAIHIDQAGGLSFNGAKLPASHDPAIESWRTIRNLTLRFKLKDSAKFSGKLNRVTIVFDNADGRLVIPKLDPVRSKIDGSDRFSRDAESRENDVVTSKSMALTSNLDRASEFSIGLQVQDIDWKNIIRYVGVYWEITNKKSIQGSVSFGDFLIDGESVDFSANSTAYVYHDAIRSSDGSITRDKNLSKGLAVFNRTVNKTDTKQNVSKG